MGSSKRGRTKAKGNERKEKIVEDIITTSKAAPPCSPKGVVTAPDKKVQQIVDVTEAIKAVNEGKYDNKPDCIVVEHIGGPRGMIDVEAIRTGEDTYELQGIRFLKKDK